MLATFPDYGLSYKYGGWHLTRTIAFSPAGKLYISVGSSCNACVEKEKVRASVIEMNPDGSTSAICPRPKKRRRPEMDRQVPMGVRTGCRPSRPAKTGRNVLRT